MSIREAIPGAGRSQHPVAGIVRPLAGRDDENAVMSYGEVVAKALKVMERETGIEPATNSLEVCESFDSKGLSRFCMRVSASEGACSFSTLADHR